MRILLFIFFLTMLNAGQFDDCCPAGQYVVVDQDNDDEIENTRYYWFGRSEPVDYICSLSTGGGIINKYTFIRAVPEAGDAPLADRWSRHTYSAHCVDIPECDDNETWDSELQTCVQNCPTYSHYDISQEECVCNNGSPMVNGECQVPDCPSFYNSLPLQHRLVGLTSYELGLEKEDCINTPGVARIEFLSENTTGLACCFYNSPDSNSSCAVNEIEIDGICYQISVPDENQTDPEECPAGQYWSIIENSCQPFFPENNGTGGGSGDGDSSGGGDNGGDSNDTGNGTGGGSGDGASGAMSQDDYKSGLQQYGDKLTNLAKKALDGYVLINLPVSVSGQCNSELRKTFNILGHTYVVDLSSQFAQIDSYSSVIYQIVLFIFAISGVVAVLAGKGD